MPRYKLVQTRDFEKEFKKLPEEIKKRFQKQFRRVAQNPYATGKPLGHKEFRELKNKNFRVYYMIYNTKIIVLLVGASDKKAQKSTIYYIKKTGNYSKV